MKKITISIFFLLIMISGAIAQTAPDGFTFTSRPATQSSYSINGWGNNYDDATIFDIVFGQFTDGSNSNDIILSSFEISGKTYSPITLPNGECYNLVTVNRKVNSEVTDLDKQTLFFEKDGTNNGKEYFTPSYTNIQEAVNTRIMNRGGDNVFSNRGGNTLNNIERIDLLITGGVFTPDNSQAGFVINERGGNDEFYVAAVTALNSSNEVTALGTPVLVSHNNNDWGNTGRTVTTTVFQRTSADAQMRPSQNISPQNIHSVFITYSDLGIANNQIIYGIAVFPGDITPGTTDLIGLSNVPLNTTQKSNQDGGLDLMGGGGYFGSEDVQVVDLQVELTSDNMAPDENDIINLTVEASNNGPLRDSNITVTTTIPAGYTYISKTSGHVGNVVVSSNNETITWTFTSLEADITESLILQVRAEASGNRVFESEISGKLTDVVPGNNDDNLEVLLASDQNPFPVSLINFNTKSHPEYILISWSTATEINNDYFEIEKSYDGEVYYSIGMLNGSGNSNSVLKYEFKDYQLSDRVTYYRLKQVDFDGQHEFFGPVSVNPDLFKNQVSIYPNPNNGVFTISGLSSDVEIAIFNQTAQLVMQRKGNASSMQLDISEYPSGIYFLKIIKGNDIQTRKFLVE